MAGLTGPDRQDFVEYLREAAGRGFSINIMSPASRIPGAAHGRVSIMRKATNETWEGDSLDEAIEKFVDAWPSMALASA